MKFVVGREDRSCSPSMADNMKKRKMMKALKKEEEEEAADRISGLPEPIIHYIMSLLPIQEITHMSTLSKNFFSTWRSYPILVFDYALFANLRLVKKTGRKQIQCFLDSIHDSLQNRSLELTKNNNQNYNLQRLKFWGPIDYSFWFDTTFDEMLDFALMNNVKEMSLNVEAKYCDYRNKRKPYHFGVDHAIFNASSNIRVLKLKGFYLKPNHEDDDDNIVLNFPSLEKFTLKKCCGFTSITLSGEKLKAVKLDSCEGLKRIHIDAPKSLESFSFGGVSDKCEISISCCEVLKYLELKSENYVDEFRVESNIYRFRCLEELVIWRGCFFKNTGPLYFERLRSLEVDDCEFGARFEHDLDQIRFDLRNSILVS